MRRMENDLLFFHELIGNCSVEKDSKIYTISPKFGKGTMQSFEVMPGAEIVYSNVHITTPIQKNIQCIDRFIEVTYCFHGRVNMLFSDQPEMIMSDHYISVFNGASHLKSCDFGEEPFVGVSVVAYLPQIINSLNIMLGTIAFDEDMDFQGLFTAGGCFIAPATKSVEHIFTELLLLPEQYRNYLNWQLGLIAAIVTILAWLVSKGMNKVSLREAAGRQEQSERLTDAVLSFVEGIGVIKSYNLLGEKSEELSGNFKRSRNTSLDFERKMTPWTMGLNILYGIGIAAIFGLSIVLEQNGALSLAYVLGVLLFVFDLFGPLKALYGEASRLTVMNAALDRIEAVLDEPELSDNGKQHIPAQAQPGQPEVLFNDVTFAYQDKEVLHHISFAMKKNSMTALVGPSGSGKSTIANLLARLWDVKSGNVTIRGVDIRNVPLSELMNQISMVFQRVYLFQDTIYNNIIMGKPDATEEEVYEAARKARCYDFIMALPDGFQTVVGEGGATLSGGEKQRISIARCILKDAPIVILDEATASVDTDNESYIQEAISELVKGKTLLVIAHRLNTIQNADQILVIDNGQIAQQGTHEKLLKQPGIYQDFVNIRKSAAGWSLA